MTLCRLFGIHKSCISAFCTDFHRMGCHNGGGACARPNGCSALKDTQQTQFIDIYFHRIQRNVAWLICSAVGHIITPHEMGDSIQNIWPEVDSNTNTNSNTTLMSWCIFGVTLCGRVFCIMLYMCSSWCCKMFSATYCKHTVMYHIT